MSEATARAAVDAVVTRDGLHLPPDEYDRLVNIYDELQSRLAELRAAEFHYSEPAVIYAARRSRPGRHEADGARG